jgi:XTP/dITP diphosphohydrolase
VLRPSWPGRKTFRCVPCFIFFVVAFDHAEQRVTAMNIKLILASCNPGKLTEFQSMANSNPSIHLELLPGFVTLATFHENAATFAENAAGKALHYSQFTNGLIFADDSGLVVTGLGGAPGVHSARYAGPHATDAQRNEKLLKEMAALTGDTRRAHFICAIAAAQKNRAIAVITARVDGEILPAPRGSTGFGYDPIFFIRELDKTFAELSANEKNKISHRGKAFRRLLEVLR